MIGNLPLNNFALVFSLARSLPEKLTGILETSQESLLCLLDLHSAKFGCHFDGNLTINEKSSLLAYVLSWQLVLEMFKEATANDRAEYANFLRKRNYIGKLLTIVFGILPTQPPPNVVQRSIAIAGNFSEIFHNLSRHRAISKAELSILASPPPFPLLSCLSFRKELKALISDFFKYEQSSSRKESDRI